MLLKIKRQDDAPLAPMQADIAPMQAPRPPATHWSLAPEPRAVELERVTPAAVPYYSNVSTLGVNSAGQVIDYSPDIGAAIREEMARGYSLSAAAAAVGVTTKTARRWREEQPVFGDHVEMGEALRLRRFERRAIDICEGAMAATAGQAAMLRYALMSAGQPVGEWREKAQIEHSGQVSLAALVESSLALYRPGDDAKLIDGGAEDDD